LLERAATVRAAPLTLPLAPGRHGAGAETAMPSTRDEDLRRRRFEGAVLPHLGAAYNLARWLARDGAQAEDLVQTACLRALRFFDGCEGSNPRAWLLAIVRNAFYSSRERRRADDDAASFDEEIHTGDRSGPDPEAALLRRADAALLRQAIGALPAAFREVIVLREIEGLSYKEIAAVAGIPIGTVMSRLARARQHLQDRLAACGVEVGGA
jgi:RNA polymerase sigma-70 factor, ECF subfamily